MISIFKVFLFRPFGLNGQDAHPVTEKSFVLGLVASGELFNLHKNVSESNYSVNPTTSNWNDHSSFDQLD